MKLIIDINDNEYMGIKEYPNNITSYPVTIHIYNAVRKGIPLDKIRAEIEELDGKYVIEDYATYGEHSPKYVQLMEVLQVIDKYRNEVSEE